jgi:carbonic anhydrase/acetyltransferase-like protein (isoleucine patch superfamily)
VRVSLPLPKIDPTAFVAPNATVRGDVTIGPDASVWFGAVVRAELAPVTVGARTNIQDGAVLHADEGEPCVVGEGVTVGHGAVVHGCTVEDDCLVGIHAVVLNRAVIGRGSTAQRPYYG